MFHADRTLSFLVIGRRSQLFVVGGGRGGIRSFLWWLGAVVGTTNSITRIKAKHDFITNITMGCNSPAYKTRLKHLVPALFAIFPAKFSCSRSSVVFSVLVVVVDLKAALTKKGNQKGHYNEHETQEH
jgi:hypothetical protein